MPAFWLALTAALGNLIKGSIAYWAVSLLAGFGLHLVAQKFAVEPALAEIQSNMTGLGSTAVAWFAYLRIDQAITIVLSAYAASAAMSAVRLRVRPAQ